LIGKPVLCDDEIDDILESGKSKETPNTQPRRSSRKRKTPGYLKDYMISCFLHYDEGHHSNVNFKIIPQINLYHNFTSIYQALLKH
jgi:hypothetical protein